MTTPSPSAQSMDSFSPRFNRERICIDKDWRFAIGHPSDKEKDFAHNVRYFSYWAKTGYGDGPAAAEFDDRTWRLLDLPHDWAVEMPNHSRASHSHGYRTIGPDFPDSSVGWYRKKVFIPETDEGRRLSVVLDGAFRDSHVWVNGFFCGHEPSGFTDISYDITDYVDFGQENTIAVRLDASSEEGWYYEGAGLYRHVWLVKTSPLHVARHGTCVTAEVGDASARICIDTTIANDSFEERQFTLRQEIISPGGDLVAVSDSGIISLEMRSQSAVSAELMIDSPGLWSVEDPSLYTLVTFIMAGDDTVSDRYETPFGIRSIRFDPNEGFFLNGKHVYLKGTNNHQDHAGVGAAIPDSLWKFRLLKLKEMGGNAYRCSHHPPSPELLDWCDRLGILVIDENRLMGSNACHLEQLEAMILRDRNHPSIILWSIGNEEWAIEGNEKGARIAATMQARVHQLDPSRPVTAAVSGGWDNGIGSVIEVMGYNYFTHGDTDEHHRKFPWQPSVGTEETTIQSTRGIYYDDRENGHLAPLEDGFSGGNAVVGWNHYVARPYLAGLFYWTGFDYRGEPNPLSYPAVSSQMGILDMCGYPKDSFYFIKSWWTEEPLLHIARHWNWPGREGEAMPVVVYSNVEEVELFLNGDSLGRKKMARNGFLKWTVDYEPGTLLAVGLINGQRVKSHQVSTTLEASAIRLHADRKSIAADGMDVAVVTVAIHDDNDTPVPTAMDNLAFRINGPGKVIGVGNGNPGSHEADQFLSPIRTISVKNWMMTGVTKPVVPPESGAFTVETNWEPCFSDAYYWQQYSLDENAWRIFQGTFDFDVEELQKSRSAKLLLRCFGEVQTVYLNGKIVISEQKLSDPWPELMLDTNMLNETGTNTVTIVASRINQENTFNSIQWKNPVEIRLDYQDPIWKRKAFNGLAQVIIKSTGEPGDICLSAEGESLKSGSLTIPAIE